MSCPQMLTNTGIKKLKPKDKVSKTKTPHIVPLSSQALAILKELQTCTGEGRYVFPSARTNARPMFDNAVLAAFRRSGIKTDE